MSVASLPIPERTQRKSVEKMNKSGEIDVFEAARYFSGFNANSSFSQKILREERNLRGGRISLDMATRNILLPQQSCSMENQMKEKIKYKQPSSPGGRLANFLSSLFNQSSSKKKKKKNLKSSSTMAGKEEEEIPGGTKKRRSSISHFRSYITMDSKSVYSSSSSGFRTPPPHAETPIKNLKEFRTQKYKSAAPENDELGEKRSERDETEKYMSLKNGYLGKDRIWGGEYASEKKEFRKIEIDDDDDDDDDGEDSVSSSDLFELQIYDFYSSDLPVYESTSLDRNRIKRGPPTSIASPPL